eukprot:COSAG03_NODE_2767_length_2462_cov_3.867541_2_plen_86_part_00
MCTEAATREATSRTTVHAMKRVRKRLRGASAGAFSKQRTRAIVVRCTSCYVVDYFAALLPRSLSATRLLASSTSVGGSRLKKSSM